MKAKQFDREFDKGAGILQILDLTRAKRTLQEQRRVNVDFPRWMIERLDKEADRMGDTRQSVIKIWLAERLGKAAS